MVNIKQGFFSCFKNINKYQRYLLVSIFLFILIFSSINILNHYSFNTGRDLAILQEAHHNTLNGNFFYSREYNINWLADHFVLFQLFLMPFYFLFSSSYTLIILQTLALAIAAFPLFRIAQKKLASDKLAFLIALIYLLHPVIFGLNLEEVHAVVFGIPLLLFSIYYLFEKNYNLFYTFIFFTLIIKETAFLVVIPLSIYIFFKISKKHGLRLFISSFALFLLLILVIMPSIGSLPFADEGSYAYTIRYSYLGDSPSEIIRSAITNPSLIIEQIGFDSIFRYSSFSLKFLLFLPLLSLFSFVALPFWAINLLSSDPFQRCVFGHHNSLIIPILFVSLIFSINFLKRKFNIDSKKIVILLLVFSFIMFISFSVKPFVESNETIYPECYVPREINLNSLSKFNSITKVHKVIESLPSTTLVKPSYHFYPYFVNSDSTLLRQHVSDSWSSEYIFFDSRDFEKGTFDLTTGMSISSQDTLFSLFYSKDFSVIFEGDGLFILKKN